MPNAGELTDEVVDGFLPWSDKVPQECKLKPEVWEKVREMRDEPILNVDPAVFEDEVLTLELPRSAPRSRTEGFLVTFREIS